MSCNTVINYFCTAGENLATSIIAIHGYDTSDINDLYAEHPSNNFSFQHVDSDMAKDIVNGLLNKTSTSFDKVPIKLLKSSVITIALAIATCVNAMIDSSEYPTELLKGRLKLIHKAGSLDFQLSRINDTSLTFESV